MNMIIPLTTAKELKKAIRFFCIGCADKGEEITLNPEKMKALKIDKNGLGELLEFEEKLNTKINLYD